MKKILFVLLAILRLLLILAPGVAFGWWAWCLAPAVIAIPAAIGVELAVLFVFFLISVAVQVARGESNTEEPDEKSTA